jgi:hypothetical protein
MARGRQGRQALHLQALHLQALHLQELHLQELHLQELNQHGRPFGVGRLPKEHPYGWGIASTVC